MTTLAASFGYHAAVGDTRSGIVPAPAAGVPGTPRALFDVPAWRDYDVAIDGRFIAVVSQVVGAKQPLAVIVNWRGR